MKLLEELAARQRFGMKPGLDAMRRALAAIGNPERALRGVIHVAGTNGKGAVCAILDACLRAGGFRVGRYTSPHLVRINERFFLDGAAVSDERLDDVVENVRRQTHGASGVLEGVTYFEFLTLVAFALYGREDPDFTILETGLGGLFDATNVCLPQVTVITRIGLDHCDWLGDTVEKIACQKAGIIKPGVPIVLGENQTSVCEVIETCANEVGAPFYYAPDEADASEIPADFSLSGSFNCENAVTALAALKVVAATLPPTPPPPPPRTRTQTRTPTRTLLRGFANIVWPGRFQRVGDFIVDGAHNPPAARALAKALADAGFAPHALNLICGFCGDKDVDEVLRILSPFVVRGFAVQTNNPRSLTAEETAAKLAAAGIPATPCSSLPAALASAVHEDRITLVAGSLFLAGEALVSLNAAPWGSDARFDAAERHPRFARSI